MGNTVASAAELEDEFGMRIERIGMILPFLNPWYAPAYSTRLWYVPKYLTPSDYGCDAGVVLSCTLRVNLISKSKLSLL